MLGLGMDTGKLGSAGSTGKLGSAAFFSRKRDFLKELEFPSCINLLEQKKHRCHRKREDSWRTASAPAGIWGFCIQNHPVPTKNKERKHSQGICSWVLAWAASALSRNHTALLRGKRMTKSGYSHPESRGHWHFAARDPPAASRVYPGAFPFAWLQFSPSFWKPLGTGRAPGGV